MSFQKWLNRREYGFPSRKGDADFVMRSIYDGMDIYEHWNTQNDVFENMTGAIFNLEFSPQGNVLVAACEKKCVMVFDTITTKNTFRINDAHTDNVNCIRFLDDRMFASCSDDTTIALWDLRNMKSKVRSLNGHSNWVKNIEYSHKDNLLVTSSFDGSIFSWDINSQTEVGLLYQRVFHTSGLMRCRISPDGTKMVICTTGGYIIIIHNLDLTTLHKDLCGFRPSIFRLMQMGHQYIPQAAKFDHVFSKKQKKNRVELVSDFPSDDDAEVILALQIHPNGHSFLSRNISTDESTEWSCVHSIFEEPGDITKISKEMANKRPKKRPRNQSNSLRINTEDNADSIEENVFISPRRMRMSYRRLNPHLHSTNTPSSSSTSNARNNISRTPPIVVSRTENFVPDIWAAEVTVRDRAIRQNRERNSAIGYNFVYAISSGVMMPANLTTNDNDTDNDNQSSTHSSNSQLRSNNNRNNDIPINNDDDEDDDDEVGNDNDNEIIVRPYSITSKNNNRYIFQNPKKLVYYKQESNSGKGYIKEPSYSGDGRIICSPYEDGIRLLGYNQECSEYPYRISSFENKTDATELVELKIIHGHEGIVLCSKFSQREPLIVTGCSNGKIAWHHPIL